MDLWEWFTTSTTSDSLFTTFGLGALAILFATDRIITRGQHARRVADLEGHHGRELAVAEARLADAKASAAGWKEVALRERELRESVTTGAVAAATGALVDVKHVLESLDESLDGSERQR